MGLSTNGSTFINVEFVCGRMCYVKFIDIVFDSWLCKKEGFIIQMRWIHSGWINKDESQFQVISSIFVQNFTSVVPFVLESANSVKLVKIWPPRLSWKYFSANLSSILSGPKLFQNKAFQGKKWMESFFLSFSEIVCLLRSNERREGQSGRF